MRVLHVETGRHLYGGGRQVLYLLQGLGRMQAGEHFLACAAGSELELRAREAGTNVYALPLAGDLDLLFAWRLRKLLREVDADIVHVHSRGAAEIWSGLAAAGSSVKTVLSRRVDNPEPWWQSRLKYPLYDRVNAISRAIYRILLGQGVPDSKLSCVPSAVDTDRYRPGCDRDWFLQEFGLQEQDRVLGTVAQLIPRKGHVYLLQALPRILEGCPEAKLLFLGQGPLLAELRQQAQALGVLERVQFAGFRTDLHWILPCLEMLVHPALLEGLGVSLLQAAAAGLPIVASRTGGVPEIVLDQENGFLLQPGQIDPLARAVLSLLQDPDSARRMGHRGRELVGQRFSVSAMVKGNLQVYQELMGAAGQGGSWEQGKGS
ncbi:MAG: glycosyltransferase family 4 protein [Desulfohalobiaceae bacterium]